MKYYLLLIAVFFASCLTAQDVSLLLQKSPHLSRAERTAAWNKLRTNTTVSFATSEQRFPATVPPNIPQKTTWQITTWKNEKVHTQILVATKNKINNVKVIVGNLQDNKGNIISSNNISTGFVQYLTTDEFAGGCGYRVAKNFDSSQVADIINTSINAINISKNNVQPIWLSIRVPADAVAGNYEGSVTIMADKKYVLQIALTVVDRTLPSPKDWTFRLDLWQHPAAIARIHNTPLWSNAHFDWMRKYYTMLANAGQKTITASIVDEPWGHQTFDDYPSLVKWTKKKNGEWSFDYSLFDRYISFMMSCGIHDRINCYSMVPWKVAFKYYDEALGKDTVFTDAIGTPGYNTNWSAMLKDFTKHLKEKGWFNITTIAMDERPMEAMKSVIRLLKTIDKDWKISLAGEYHPEIESDIFDYCVASKWTFPKDILQARAQQGKASTWYTCCTEKYPNLFTFSPPAEAVWIGWYTAATGMDGYLRWAYNSWPRNPLADSRFTAWPAGDTYQIFPGPLSSIRFEKTIEGIQDFEKIKILRQEYARNNEKEKLNKLEAVLKIFSIQQLSSTPAQDMIEQGKIILNSIENNTIKVMTYNVHHCNPPAKPKVIDVDAIAAVIKNQGADIVALQEIDINTGRSGKINEAEQLAAKSGYKFFFFAKAIDFDGGEYGVTILSKHSLSDTHAYALPSESNKDEPRVLATATVTLENGKRFRFGCTHLDAGRSDASRILQIKEISRIASETPLPFIVAGDFNALEGGPVINTLDENFRRTCNKCAATFNEADESGAIDFIAFKPKDHFKTLSHTVIPEKNASDHMPVVAVFQLKF